MQIMSMRTFEKQLNDLTFTDYYVKLKMLATSRFEWKGLPDFMDERWIEDFLFDEGECMGFIDEYKGPIVSQCVQNGKVNNYNDPTVLCPAGVDMPSHKSFIVGDECVHIKNNDYSIPTSYFIKLFAYRLAEISRTIDINIKAQKTPILVIGPEKQKLTLKQVYSKYEGNEPVIFGDKSLDTDSIRVLNTDAPIVFPQLHDQKQNVWNECLTFLGINNANTDKRERLIVGEVEANDVHIDLSAECFLKARQKAAEQLNKLWGTNITVEMRIDSMSDIAVEDEGGDEACMQDTQKS